mmetsp:Transcript_3077/g.8444  ORF Transcript_3077/g.8444 Transcript_3077/m.8444 type:complete len:90 (-) Transcript_3077:1042-1311(-)
MRHVLVDCVEFLSVKVPRTKGQWTTSLKEIAHHEPKVQAGRSFEQLLVKPGKVKAHHFFMFAGPYGSMLASLLADDVGPAQHSTYELMF